MWILLIRSHRRREEQARGWHESTVVQEKVFHEESRNRGQHPDADYLKKGEESLIDPTSEMIHSEDVSGEAERAQKSQNLILGLVRR